MNRIPATISAIDTDGSIALVDATAAGFRFTALLVGAGNETTGWHVGMPATLLFKETEVSLAKGLEGRLSLRNRFPAVVTAIRTGRLLTRVDLDFAGHPLAAVITTRAGKALELHEGDQVEGLVKANEMTLVAGEEA